MTPDGARDDLLIVFVHGGGFRTGSALPEATGAADRTAAFLQRTAGRSACDPLPERTVCALIR